MKPAAKWTMITGGALTLGGSVLGLIGTVIGMRGSFNTLETSGANHTEALASDIGVTLMSTVGGIILGGLGLLIFLGGVVIWLVTRKSATPPPINP
ncbi:MAG: MotA/TolQ/ExbB proton channel family protein [Candidatus Methylacidiphilales bacterium]